MSYGTNTRVLSGLLTTEKGPNLDHMPAALAIVNSPILHPVAARAGDVLAWFPARTIEVWRHEASGWRLVRSLPHDNSGALAGLLADEIIAPVSAEHSARLHGWMAVASAVPAPGDQGLRVVR